MEHARVGFIGGGQMAAALLQGALQSGVFQPEQLTIIENSPERREHLRKIFPDVKIGEAIEQAEACDKIILAVKPQVLRQIGTELATRLPGDRLWISIAAGISLAELEKLMGSNRLIRVMPNTPAQVGEGAAGMAAGSGADDQDIEWARRLMQAVGKCVSVSESQMHAVTGIAGSSPAYIFMVIEALSDAGVAGGLPRDIALQLSAQAVLGAARMVLETGLHPGQLKDQVTSPSGTTIEAVRALESAGIRSAMIEAVLKCIQRSKELEIS